jgi:hypothetical protein
MGRKCSICEHEKLVDIDKAILDNVSNRAVAGQYGVSREAVRRHQVNGHIENALIHAHDAKEIKEADDVFGRLSNLHDRAMAVLNKAELEQSYTVMLNAIREVRSIIETQAKCHGLMKENEINIGMQVNVADAISITRTFLEKKHPEVARELHKHMVEIYDTQYSVE